MSEDGRFLSRRLAPQIAAHDPTRIITSEENKAIETGQIIAGELGVPWQTAANLHEHDRRGVPYFDSLEAFESVVADFFARPDERVFGRETAGQAQSRFTQAVNTVLTNHPTGNIAIVAHGAVITLFLSQHNPQLDPFTFWRSLTLPCYFVIGKR